MFQAAQEKVVDRWQEVAAWSLQREWTDAEESPGIGCHIRLWYAWEQPTWWRRLDETSWSSAVS